MAEVEGRRWLAFEERQDYLAASIFRFLPKDTAKAKLEAAYEAVSAAQSVDLTAYLPRTEMFQTAAE